MRSPDLFAQIAIAFEEAAYQLEENLSEERLALLDEALAMLEGQESAQRVHVLCWRVRAAAAVATIRAGSIPAGFAVFVGRKDPQVRSRRPATCSTATAGRRITCQNGRSSLTADMPQRSGPAVAGQHRSAEQHFETALEANDRMGFHAWTAWTRLNYGDMLLKHASTSSAKPDDRERAHALLEEALAFAKEHGMGMVQRDAQALLEQQA